MTTVHTLVEAHAPHRDRRMCLSSSKRRSLLVRFPNPITPMRLRGARQTIVHRMRQQMRTIHKRGHQQRKLHRRGQPVQTKMKIVTPKRLRGTRQTTVHRMKQQMRTIHKRGHKQRKLHRRGQQIRTRPRVQQPRERPSHWIICEANLIFGWKLLHPVLCPYYAYYHRC